MNKKDKHLLIKQATKLAQLGLNVEDERNKLKGFVERGLPYDAPEMIAALQNFEKVDAEWKRLEDEHLIMRKKFGIK